MMQTIDGKIASGVADIEIIMDFFDTYTTIEHELDGNVWMFGRITGGAFAEAQGTPLPPIEKQIDPHDYVASLDGKTFAIVVDTKGVLRWNKNYINLSNQPHEYHLIIIVTESTPKEYLAYLQENGISYVLGGEKEIDFVETLKKLKEKWHIEKILLEGGGSFNGSMMNADVVDEISLLLLPRVLNKKDAPSLFDTDTQSVDPKDYELLSTKQLENGVLWLRYKKV